MADLAETETTTAEAAAPLESEAPATGETEAASTQEQEQQQAGDDEGELVVTIGEEAPPQQDEQPAPAWVRELRKRDRENQKRIKQLEQQLAEKTAPAQADVLPAKPTLEGCDYDADRFEAELLKWNDAKRQHEQRQQEAQKRQEQATQDWKQRVQSYETAKKALPVDDMEDAEAKVFEALKAASGENEGMIRAMALVEAFDNAHMLVYALARYPERLKALAATPKFAQFIRAATLLESELKVTKRTPTVSPEKPVTGTAAVGIGGSDATLERLRAEADKTGDRTPVVRYLAQQRKLKG